MRISLLLVLLLPSFVYAAANTKPNKPPLEERLNRQADQIRKLKNENTVLRKTLNIKEARQAKKVEQVNAAVAFSEKAIFDKFSESYQRGEKEDYRKALRLLSKNYPNSQYFPEIYYMTAQSSFAKGKHKTAIKAYNMVLSKYPKSKKVPAAMLGKALTYKELKLNKQALSVFADIQKRFPNTPEAYRAGLQQKLMAKKKGK